MFKKQTKIIAIDNNSDHLSILTKSFHDNGIGCLPILYDQLSPPQTPFTNVRLAFFDINLRDTTNNSEIFNDLSNALNDYIHVENGPFALIFWTQNQEIVAELITYINTRRPETPTPYLIKCIDKDKFYPIQNDSLETELGQILSSPTLKLLLDFEENAQDSASSVINSIYSLIPKSQNWGDFSLFETNFDLVFSKIAISALGHHYAKENPDKAIYEALSPIIANKLMSSDFGTEWSSILTSLSNSNNLINYPNEFCSSKLNSIFHVDTISEVNLNHRGAVFLYNLQPLSATRFNYFKNLEVESKELFNKFIQFSETETNSSERESIRCNSKFIVIEISASCDFSQNKQRNNKYVLGLLTPPIDQKKIQNISDSILYRDLPVLHILEADFTVWINLNFVFSDLEPNKSFVTPLFIFKKEIMDMIGNRYANHVSRIGITSF